MPEKGASIYSNAPLVTVYIPCRNYARYLTQSVTSLRDQLYPRWELFIVDDASTDATTVVAEGLRLQDPDRVRVITNAEPEGLQKVANHVLKLASGKYLMRLDADDWLDESALLLMVAKLESDPKLGLVYGNYFYTDEAGNVLGTERRRKIGVEDVTLHLPPHGACTMVRTRALKAVGGYSEDVDAQDGWDLWHKLSARVKVASLEAPVFYYRQHDTSLSKDTRRMLSARGRIVAKARERLNDSFSPSCLAVIPVKETFREEFKGVPYLELKGRSLLELALASAQNASGVTEVAISSESSRVLDFAADLSARGIVRPHLRVARPAGVAHTHIRLRDILLHAGEAYHKVHGAHPDIVLFLSLHAPLRSSLHVDKAIDTLRVHACDSVVSVCEEVEAVFVHGRDGLRLLNPGRFDELIYESERLLAFNGAVLGVWWEVLVAGDVFGENVGFVEMTEDDSAQVKRLRDLRILQMVDSEVEQPPTDTPALSRG